MGVAYYELCLRSAWVANAIFCFWCYFDLFLSRYRRLVVRATSRGRDFHSPSHMPRHGGSYVQRHSSVSLFAFHIPHYPLCVHIYQNGYAITNQEIVKLPNMHVFPYEATPILPGASYRLVFMLIS